MNRQDAKAAKKGFLNRQGAKKTIANRQDAKAPRWIDEKDPSSLFGFLME